MLRRRSSGVARFSQHMLGHAMDFFIPDVPLEQIRFAGLRLQRGGVGFYPTSGSPFVHLDTGSIRHWPRMTHDQLARVFPDGHTVHVPSDGNPLRGYDLALADIQKRGDDASANSKPGLFARLFKGKPNEEDDDAASAPVAGEKTAPASLMAAALPAKSADKSADPVPTPRSKPQGSSTFQLASADVQIVQPAKSKRAAAASTEKAEPKPQTPADIINARGFWGDAPATPKQASPAQVAAISARQAVTSADPQATASISAAFQALAYAPVANSPVDRANIVAASAPVPLGIRPASAAHNLAAAVTIDQVVAKGPQGQGNVIATSTRIAAATGNDVWMRVMILAPSASASMSTTVLGDTDMTLMRMHFVKPQAIVTMSFSDDPQMGLTSEQFTGSAIATLATQSFVMRTASLR
jgi:hypothetical protein